MSAAADIQAGLPFLKMHGLGNDFVIIDARHRDFVVSQKLLKALGSRRRGPGCDQIIVLRRPTSRQADLYMAIYNGDGTEAGACGNASRCVASLLFTEQSKTRGVIETVSGHLSVWQETPDLFAVDFGAPKLDWRHIPLAYETDTLSVPLTSGVLAHPCCVSMGNPHAVFFVEDVAAINLRAEGPLLETNSLFPERCNIEIAQILAKDHIRMRVWERSAGITEACGSGACAVLVAAVRRGLTERRARVTLDGGELTIEWRDDNHVVMIGAASLSYRGLLAKGFGDDAVAS